MGLIPVSQTDSRNVKLRRPLDGSNQGAHHASSGAVRCKIVGADKDNSNPAVKMRVVGDGKQGGRVAESERDKKKGGSTM